MIVAPGELIITSSLVSGTWLPLQLPPVFQLLSPATPVQKIEGKVRSSSSSKRGFRPGDRGEAWAAGGQLGARRPVFRTLPRALDLASHEVKAMI
jgi:hypothetical protein